MKANTTKQITTQQNVTFEKMHSDASRMSTDMMYLKRAMLDNEETDKLRYLTIIIERDIDLVKCQLNDLERSLLNNN